MKKAILWDFNGTLIDDVDLCVEIVNKLYQVSNIDKTLTRSQYQAVFDFPVINYYRNAGFDVSDKRFEEISIIYTECFLEGFKRVNLYDDILEAINMAKDKGYQNFILSASYQKHLDKQVAALGLDVLFEGVFGIQDIYAKSKVEVGLNFKQQYDFDEVIMIGDTLHDAEVAMAIGSPIYLVARGHVSKERLEASPYNVYESAKEVVECLE